MYSLEPEHFEERRRTLMDAIGPDGVAIFTANPRQRRSHDTYFPYRPSSAILYLTGFTEPQAVVVLAPGHDEGEFAMFVRDRDEEAETWNGRRHGPEGAEEDFGANVAHPIDDLDEKLPEFLETRDSLYYTLGDDPDFDERVVDWVNDLRHRRNEPSAAPGRIVDARDLLHEQRLCKRPEEIELLRRANRVTAQAHVLAMRHCQPGMDEYELEALLEYHFRREGAEFPAYPSIVASGNNATVLHYTDNRDELEEDDVVLIDAGCEFEYYAGDITRSFPVSGEFAPAVRDLYQAVLEVQCAAIDDVEPGRPFEELQERTVERIAEVLVDFDLLDGPTEEIVEEESYKEYFPHKVSHWLGLDVHDVPPYFTDDGDSRPLEPGMTLTVEPGIYVDEADESAPEALRGTGIRIEDDVVVRQDGHENLSADCPKTADEIEDLVGSADGPPLPVDG
ncbi:MAG: aminopeptidase P N-terminal domain-containing protein [Bradymonadaceae bacterium]